MTIHLMPAMSRQLGPGVEMAIWGAGNARNFSAVTGDFLPGIVAAELRFRAPVHLARVAFKNKVLSDLDEPSDQYKVIAPLGSIRVERQGDVMWKRIAEGSATPIVFGFLNADSPGLVGVLRSNRGKVQGAYFAHAGLECLIGKGDPGALSVLQTIKAHAAEYYHDSMLELFLAGGIRECCYGNNRPELVEHLAARYGDDFAARILAKFAQKGPRALSNTGEPNRAIDLPLVLEAEVRHVFGFNPRQVSIGFSDYPCTACAGETDSEKQLWSHVYGGPVTPLGENPRNLACFAIDPVKAGW